jgi:hypothetical protein
MMVLTVKNVSTLYCPILTINVSVSKDIMKVPTILQELVFRSKFVQSRNSLVKIVVSVSNVATFAVVVIAQMIVRVALVWQMLTWLAGISL